MNAEKTPLIQKLILGVLALILVCLVILIAQNRSKQTIPLPEANTTTEPVSRHEPEAQPIVEAPPAKSSTVVMRPQSAREGPTPATSQAAPQIQQAPQAPVPQPPVTLVNPVRPEPLDIVVQSKTPALKTELCGRVRLEGEPPAEIPISMDAKCRTLHNEPVTTRHYVVGRQGGLANVLVYIKDGLPSHYSPPLISAPTVTVSRCFFEPYVLGMQAGQKITFSNADNILHNIHGTAKMNREFNLGLAPGSRQNAGRVLENPEVFVRLKCDVHAWEFCYVGIIPHPFFAVTDTNGVFCLPAGLPHGRYTVAAVHPKAGETLQEVIVQENLNLVELAFTIPRR